MLTSRFLSEKLLYFTVVGRPLCGGNQHVYKLAKRQSNGAASYIALIKLIAKAAVARQKWEIADDAAVYMILTINVPPPKKIQLEEQKTQKKSDALAVRTPTVNRFGELFVHALKGIVYNHETQVVALNIVRRYGKKDEGVSVLIGSPKNWGELSHDLRNA